jgi:hypothetical protein
MDAVLFLGDLLLNKLASVLVTIRFAELL